MQNTIIVIEGTDAAGKKTQVSLLYEALQSRGKTVAKFDFPRYTTTIGGKLLYEVFKSPHSPHYAFADLDALTASLLYAMDRSESLPEIQSLRAKHEYLIFDRYTTSNMLHQGAKLPSGPQRDILLQKLATLEYEILGLPRPHHVFYLHISADIVSKRVQTRGNPDELEKNKAYLAQTESAGTEIAQKMEWYIIHGNKGIVEHSREYIHAEIMKRLPL